MSGSYSAECDMKSKKSDRAISKYSVVVVVVLIAAQLLFPLAGKNTNDCQLRMDLKADRPVQRNNMQQMKLEAFMSR